MSDLVDWRLAERTAGAMAGGLAGFGSAAGRPADGYASGEVERACTEALATVSDFAGLGEVDSSPPPELVDRREWARNALATLADAAGPLEARAVAEIGLPGPLGPVARRATATAIGLEAGAAAGYAARRVLGQYDLAVVGTPRPPRLLFVAENLDAARLDLGADRDSFLRWIALHECTHVVQFDRVPWLADHLRSIARALLDEAATGLETASFGALGRRLARDPRELWHAVLRGELARLLATPAQRERLDRLQATMAVIEGHAEHVMDACIAEREPRLGVLRSRLEERRTGRGGLGELLARMLGIGLKLRQYEVGRRFCDEVVRQAGEDGLRTVWRSASDLPSPAELEDANTWLRRVVAAAA